MLTKAVELLQLFQMKDKKILLVVLAAVVLLLGAGGYMLFANKSSVPTGPEEQIEEFEEISPEELGLSITVKPDKKYVKFAMTNVSDITHVEWEFLYDADIPAAEIPEGESGGKVTQQVIGEAEIEDDADSFESEYRELGSCSTGGKCRFDTGVEKIDLIVKITKKDGKMYQSKTSTSL
jgi:hypothetical protein